jgi:hypothetical protein
MAHTRLNPLLRWARARQAAVEQPDFGDHGTAFGMELSMAPGVHAGDTAASPTTGPTGPAEPPPTSPGEVIGMWRRLGGRRPWRED